MIAWATVQNRLGVKADSVPGPITYGALLSSVAGHDVDPTIGMALAHNADSYGVSASPQRLAAFVGQTCHESGGYKWMQEIGGDAYFTRLYENRADLGNTQPGDGARFHGRGLLQLTGRSNYRDYGKALGLDLIGNPDLAAQPSVGVLIALEFWHRHNLNAIADTGDVAKVTRAVNGGVNGLAERVALTDKALGILT